MNPVRGIHPNRSCRTQRAGRGGRKNPAPRSAWQPTGIRSHGAWTKMQLRQPALILRWRYASGGGPRPAGSVVKTVFNHVDDRSPHRALTIAAARNTGGFKYTCDLMMKDDVFESARRVRRYHIRVTSRRRRVLMGLLCWKSWRRRLPLKELIAICRAVWAASTMRQRPALRGRCKKGHGEAPDRRSAGKDGGVECREVDRTTA